MLKVLGAQIKEFKKDSILTPLCMILEVIMEMLVPLLMASIIDNGVNAGNMNHILKIGGLMIVIAIIGLFAGLGGARFGARASTGLARNLRKAMFDNGCNKYTELLSNASSYGDESTNDYDYSYDYGVFHKCEIGKYLFGCGYFPSMRIGNYYSKSNEALPSGI